MKNCIKELLQYNNKVNQALAVKFLSDKAGIPEKATEIFSHILNAQHIWNHRIRMKEPVYGVWQLHDIEEMAVIDRENFGMSMKIVEDFGLEALVTYENSSGQRYTNRIIDILFHIVNHSTYHRGQIALLFRNAGIEPVISDYIIIKRSG